MNFREKRQYIIFFVDTVIIALAWSAAFLLRFNLSDIPHFFLPSYWYSLPTIIVLQNICNYIFHVYKSSWRYCSLSDLNKIIKSTLLGFLSIILVIFFLGNNINVPRSIPFIYAFLLILSMGFPRFLYRQFCEYTQKNTQGKRVLIIGAGSAGESLVRDLLRSKAQSYNPIAFIDDSKSKAGQVIHGLHVYGDLSTLESLTKKLKIDLLIIAMPALSSKQRRRIVELCESTKLPFRTVPSSEDLASGRVALNNLRNVVLEDLLGRDPVNLDKTSISNSIKNQVVMVTGGAGSIGSELCRQIIQFSPKQLIILDSNEYNLYEIDMEFTKSSFINFVPILMDITDRDGLSNIFQTYKPQVIFHAAAYKHVPLLESQIRCAVRNNVIGTSTLAEEAAKANVQKFIMVSTDKAVNPTNIMGASKRAAEIFCQNFNKYVDTQFMTVRFGNVLGSAGSVVPLFKKQLESGGPLTVTHPDITRYFMTIEEAAQLILQAEVLGKGGEIFVLDMGEPIKIQYLAEQLIKLANLELGEDIDIAYTGLRPGEKLYEELFYEQECLSQTSHNKILLAQATTIDWQNIQQYIASLKTQCKTNDEQNLNCILQELVPEYSNKDNSLNSLDAL